MVECKLGNFKLNIEIPVCLLFFAFMFSNYISTNLLIYRTCYVILNYNITECAKLGSNNQDNYTKALEEKVQPYANVIAMTNAIIAQVIPALICLFVGPWSDKNGRKPVMLLVLTGFFMGYIIKAILSYCTYASPWFFILEYLPSVFVGGFTTYLTMVLCYATDTTDENDRGLRMGILEAFLTAGILVGTLLSSYALNHIGYVLIYIICATVTLLAVLMTYYCVPESVVIEENRDRNLFVFTHIKDIIRTAIKRRENYNRALLFMVCIVLITYALTFTADGDITFLYLREKFAWTIEKYSLYQSAKSCLNIAGTFIGVYVLHKLLKINEPFLLVLGFTHLIVSYLIMVFAVNDMQIFISAVIKCICGVISPMIRSLISKLIPNEEIGKIFSLTVIFETLVGAIGSPLYTLVYNKTISTFPSAFNLVTVGFSSFDVILVILIIIVRRNISYGRMESVINE